MSEVIASHGVQFSSFRLRESGAPSSIFGIIVTSSDEAVSKRVEEMLVVFSFLLCLGGVDSSFSDVA